MKKTLLFAGILFITASMVSCKKDYTCKCSKTYTTGSGTSTHDYSVYTYNDSRKKAESRCDDNTKQGTDLGGNYAINCAIQ